MEYTKTEKTIKKLSKDMDVCKECGLAIINCICQESPKIDTKYNFYILTTENEIYRPSNTARLLKLADEDSVKIVVWNRTEIHSEIDKILNNGSRTYLVYPLESDNRANFEEIKESKTGEVNFIIIDGKWKESAKIIRKSSYLQELPVIEFKNIEKSEYTLRKGAEEGELCTIEVVIELFSKCGEQENGRAMKEYFEKFKKRYYATLNGHKSKE